MTGTTGRFWLCASCGRHVPARLGQCRCGFSPFGDEPVTFRPAESTPAPTPAVPAQPAWFAVGTAKLVVMSVVTFGVYQMYWFYQQWKRVRDGGEDVSPLPRAIFGVVFGYPLFQRMAASSPGDAPAVGPGLLAIAYGLLCLAAQLPLPFAFVSVLSVLPLVAMQRLASATAARDFPDDDPNRRLTAANWLAVLAGGACIGLVAYSLHHRQQFTSREFLSRVAAEANAAPRAETNGTRLDRVEAQDGRLVYYFSVDEDARGRIEQARSGMKQAMKARLCRDPLLRNGVAVTFVYNDRTGREVATAGISPADCRS